jgi:transglutaminase-like putative cysteine protease
MTAQWRLTAAAAGATLLTSLSLSPTVANGDWLPLLAVTVVAVAVSAGLARQAGLPRVLTTAVALAALVIAVTVIFARDVAVLGFLPGPGVWEQLRALSRDGLQTVWDQPTPVSSTRGIQLLIVAGVGFVAVVVDAVGVTWRRAAAAGLPLLVLYLVPASVIPDGVPWPLFVVGALGWLLLLLSDGRDRLSKWGRIVSLRDDGDDRPTRVSVGGTGRRLAAVALAAAVVVPLGLPMLSEGVLGPGGGDSADGEGGPGDTGLRRVVTINPLVDLRRDLVRGEDTVVLRYTTDDATPEYLRIATLDQFDGRTWTLEEMQAGADQLARDGLPPPPGLSDGIFVAPVTTSVSVVALNSPRLPLPYPVTRVAIDGDWRWDADSFDVFTADLDGTAQGVAYTAQSLEVRPSSNDLRLAPAAADSLADYTQVPPFTETELAPLTEQVTAGETTDYDKALALQNWFRTEFTYSLDRPSGNGLSDLQAFLADRSGYCEQFSATMALMARIAGIPSRVQVGFAPGSQLADGTWEVTAHDAHAWPELWFSGVGWVRFEPTPGGGDGSATPSWAPVPVLPGTDPNASAGGSGGRAIPLRRQPLDPDATSTPGGSRGDVPGNRRTGDDRTGVAGGTAADSSGMALWPFVLAGLVLVGAALATPAVAAREARRRRWSAAGNLRSAAEAAWRDVLDTAVDLDLDPLPTETPRDLAVRLPREGRLSAAGRSAMADLARTVELARYADATEDDPDAVARVRHDSEQVTAGLRSAVTPQDARRARWWPASGRAMVMRRLGGLGARLDAWVGGMGRGARTLSGRVRRGAGPSAARSDA